MGPVQAPESGVPEEADPEAAEPPPAPAHEPTAPEPAIFEDDAVADAGLYRVAGGSAVGPQVFRLSDTVAINPPEKDPVDWKGHLVAGATFERGNSITDQANANLEVIRRGLESRFTARASVLYDRDTNFDTGEGVTSDREIDGFLKYDFFLTEKWYIFQRLSGEKDGVVDLDLRLVVGSGMGYQWVERKALNFSTEVGLAWTDERYKDDTLDNDYLAGILRWDLDSRFFDRLTFFHRGDWRPSLEDSGVVVIDTVTGLRSDLSDSFFLEAKVVWEWDSEPSTGKDRQDVDYILGLGYHFD
jgi:putative salt-induced outer membrane protein YdiY